MIQIAYGAYNFGANFIGDGASTSVSFDLSKTPFNLQFNGVLPVSVQHTSGTSASSSVTYWDPGASAQVQVPFVATLAGTVITYTFEAALAAGMNIGFSNVLLWQIG